MTEITEYADAITTELENYTPCDIADALVKYGIPHGNYIPGLSQFSPSTTLHPLEKSVVGRAYTVEYAPKDDPRPAVAGGYIDTAPRGSVVFIATAVDSQIPVAPFTTLSNALYGGLMSTRAKYLGCAGSVICGKIRDVREHNALGYPVFAYGLGTTAPTKVAKVVAVKGTLQVKVAAQTVEHGGQGLIKEEIRVVNHGDYVVADENGVVVIPANDPEFVKNVLKAIPPRVKADELVAADINNGVPAGKAQKHRRAGL